MSKREKEGGRRKEEEEEERTHFAGEGGGMEVHDGCLGGYNQCPVLHAAGDESRGVHTHNLLWVSRT